MSKKSFWLLPLIPIAVLAAAVLSLPSFVASSAHRANIEALASTLTGRNVRIKGPLSLGLYPAPQIIAGGVTITGPDAETITARSLTLDISLPALLHGQLSATNLALIHPVIAFPWPLPGGAADIAPPSWLAALHAQIQDGDIQLGAAYFSGVDADLVTGGNGTLRVSGTGHLAGHTLSLTLALGLPQLTGTTPVTLDAASGETSLHFSGALNQSSLLSGQLEVANPTLTGTASLAAGPSALTATSLQINDGKAVITGTATLNFLNPSLTANLDAADLDLSALQAQYKAALRLPTTLQLTATNLMVNGRTIPALQASLDSDAGGITLHALQASLEGNASLSASGQITPLGAIAGQASLDAPDLPGLLAGSGLTLPANWSSAHLTATLAGTTGALDLSNLGGSIGGDHFTGRLTLTGRHAAGAIHFDHLDLQPVAAWFLQHPAQNFTAEGEITATHANFGAIPLTNLLLDASLTDHVNIRRVSANLFNGLAAGSLMLNPAGQISAARGFLDLPSATPLEALLPPSWQLPAALLQPRLHAALLAEGPGTALATSLVATLGDFTLTAAPVINLAQQSAAGPLSLRAPDAIAALKIFGLSHAPAMPACNLPAIVPISATGPASPCAPPAQNIAWPGAGSLSLRADFIASPTQFGLPDFILSLGDLTANGRLIRNNGVLAGEIDAGTLALPLIPANQTLPWADLGGAQGNITLTANRVLYDGGQILGNTMGSLILAPNTATLALTQASLAGGNLSGSLTATLAANAPPALSANFTASNLNAGGFNLPVDFPFTLPTGTLAAQGSLTASGYTPRIWAATLAGTANLTAAQGSLKGFDLTGLAAALSAPHRLGALRAALNSGSTNFQTLSLAATADHGNASLTTASLTGPDGAAEATGSLDLFDKNLALQLTLHPNVTPPLALETTILGPWSAPRQYPRLKPALSWMPDRTLPPPHQAEKH